MSGDLWSGRLCCAVAAVFGPENVGDHGSGFAADRWGNGGLLGGPCLHQIRIGVAVVGRLGRIVGADCWDGFVGHMCLDARQAHMLMSLLDADSTVDAATPG